MMVFHVFDAWWSYDCRSQLKYHVFYISCDEFVSKINGYLKNIFMVLRDRGRVEDFISVMQSLSNGALPPSNVSLYLLLDVGRFLCQETVNSMRYTEGNVLTL